MGYAIERTILSFNNTTTGITYMNKSILKAQKNQQYQNSGEFHAGHTYNNNINNNSNNNNTLQQLS